MASTAPAKAPTLDLYSPHRNLWVSLETNVDEYNNQGGMRMVRPGRKVKFRNGRASVPASWREDLEAHPAYRLDFFFDEDRPDLRGLRFGPQVVSGQLGTRAPVSEEPPLPDWDTLGAREIRDALASGRVADPREALMWETRPKEGKARVQVMEALGKAIRAGQGDDTADGDGETPAADEPADGSEGYVKPTPTDAGGLS